MSEMREIRVPADLCAAAEQKFGHNFANLDELVIFVLQELLHGDRASLDLADQQIVEERLRDLGYI
jgi:hypothetical protein